MAIYAIGDLHLPGHEEKPMNVFGEQWDRHFELISSEWRQRITSSDVVLIPGDISWAMQLKDARDDLDAIAALPGQKLMIRGNHDYWWSSIGKVREILKPGLGALQNDAVVIDGNVFCGTRGWMIPAAQQTPNEQDEKIFRRELLRLDMSLKQGMALYQNQALVVMTHYPPLLADGMTTAFTEILEKYPVTNVVYGHLHGAGIKIGFNGSYHGIDYQLVSCDALGFCPMLIRK
ncbi:MAG: metallophosphoesterase [Eubacteriales bacterium]|nr:metallophosphoesterase [Eubacteriales bacterium]